MPKKDSENLDNNVGDGSGPAPVPGQTVAERQAELAPVTGVVQQGDEPNGTDADETASK